MKAGYLDLNSILNNYGQPPLQFLEQMLWARWAGTLVNCGQEIACFGKGIQELEHSEVRFVEERIMSSRKAMHQKCRVWKEDHHEYRSFKNDDKRQGKQISLSQDFWKSVICADVFMTDQEEKHMLHFSYLFAVTPCLSENIYSENSTKSPGMWSKIHDGKRSELQDQANVLALPHSLCPPKVLWN